MAHVEGEPVHFVHHVAEQRAEIGDLFHVLILFRFDGDFERESLSSGHFSGPHRAGPGHVERVCAYGAFPFVVDIKHYVIGIVL